MPTNTKAETVSKVKQLFMMVAVRLVIDDICEQKGIKILYLNYMQMISMLSLNYKIFMTNLVKLR